MGSESPELPSFAKHVDFDSVDNVAWFIQISGSPRSVRRRKSIPAVPGELGRDQSVLDVDGSFRMGSDFVIVRHQQDRYANIGMQSPEQFQNLRGGP